MNIITPVLPTIYENSPQAGFNVDLLEIKLEVGTRKWKLIVF
jgi:hypothetical protein